MRCLFIDVVFPNKLAKWRLVEIYSFLNKYDTDILVNFCDRFTIDYDELKNKFKLHNYDIYIFNSKYNYLNKYNDNFNGIKYNNYFPGFSYLFRHKKFRQENAKFLHIPMDKYDFVYSIFITPYLNFNKMLLNKYGNNIIPYEKQFIHLYPGGGCGVPITERDINIQKNKNYKKSKWISTQNYIYDKLVKHNPTNMCEVYGGPFFYKDEKIMRKINFEKKINICFTSVGGDVYKKGADIYIKIVSKLNDENITFYSVGNVPIHKNIKHLNAMSQDNLSTFYNEKIDIYLNLTRSGNGFPLGVEAGQQGCVLLTTDPYNSNIKNKFNIDGFFIININDINSIINKINLLKNNIELRKEKSYYIQDKLFELLNYDAQMEKIFNIIESNIKK